MRAAKRSNLRAAYEAALVRFHKHILVLLFLGSFTFYGLLVFKATHPDLPSAKRPILFYSNQARDDLKLVFLYALQRAKHSIFLIIYGLTDKNVIELLEKRASEGVKVEVFYDKGGSPTLGDPAFIATPLLSGGLMHKKILIIDGREVYLGSANMTASSLRMHDNFVIGLWHEKLAAYLEYSLEPNFLFTVNHQEGELWQLPENEGRALQKLIELICSAQSSISIAMFTLTHPDIADALIEAQRRGVAVRIAVDYYSGLGASKKTLAKLEAAGLSVYFSRGGKLLHHKWCLIDNKTFIFGSANWTKAAFTKNDDCMLILYDIPPYQKKFINSLWATLEI